MSSDGYTVQQALNKLALEGIISISKTVGGITFTGSGLDDMSNGGQFTGDVDVAYIVEIDDAVSSPDTFKWSDDGGVTFTEGVNCVIVPITLSNGVTVRFNAPDGHTLGDKWEFTCLAADPSAVNKTVTLIAGASIAPLATLTSSVVDLAQIRSGVLTIMGTFNALAVLGMTVEIFTSPDAVNWDTQPWADTGLEPDLVAGSTEQKSSNLDTLPRFLRVKVTDLEKGIAGLYVTFTALEE